MRGWIAALVCLVPLAGCYNTPKAACAFLCGENGDCPSGYVCGGDDRCHELIGDVPAQCEATPGIDGSATPMIDAPPGEPDALMSTPDANMSMPDAPPEDMPDAAEDIPDAPPPEIDARPVFDAPPPPIDARPPVDAPPPAIDAGPTPDA